MLRITPALLLIPTLLSAQAATSRLEVKYVRDSEEYAALARQVYRVAGRAVQQSVPQGRAWAVVLDVDETALDNSIYELERAAYGLSFADPSWDAWVRRGAAPAVPGAVAFVAEVRRLGGRVAWITNRSDRTREETRANLEAVGLWQAADVLCMAAADTSYTKRVRRAEVSGGRGRCAWPNEPVQVVAFVGDQVSDFPAGGESDPDAGNDAAFGTRFFLLPNPMYGGWVSRVTRR